MHQVKNGVTNIVEKPNSANNKEAFPIISDHEPIRYFDILHRVALEFLGFLEFDSQKKQDNWGHDTETKGNSPGGTKMVLSENQNQDIWHEGANDEAPIDGNVREHNKPGVSCTRLQLTRGLGGSDTTSRVFSSDAYANEETICYERRYHAFEATTSTVCARAERREDNHYNSRYEEGVPPRPFVTGIPKGQLAEDNSNEAYGRNITLLGRLRVCLSID